MSDTNTTKLAQPRLRTSSKLFVFAWLALIAVFLFFYGYFMLTAPQTISKPGGDVQIDFETFHLLNAFGALLIAGGVWLLITVIAIVLHLVENVRKRRERLGAEPTP